MEMEKDMESNTDKTKKWATYYEAHKEVFHNPKVSPYVKCFIRLLELHRGDSRGWSLSVRLVSKYLGISPNTARKTINAALSFGFIETNTTRPRKRRNLKLTASLRAPVERNLLTSEVLRHQVIQPASQPDTESVSPNEPVNNKEKDINANTEKSQVKPEKKIEESNPYKKGVPQGLPNTTGRSESKGFTQLREVVEGIRRK